MANISELDPQLGMIYELLNKELKQSDDYVESSTECNSDQKPAAQYCVPYCAYDRQQGNASMIQCCCCMQWFHPSCCNEDKKVSKGFWACLECRKTSERIINLEKKVDLLANLNMKLIILLHDKHAKFLEPNPDLVKLPPLSTKKSTETQTSVMDRVFAEQKEQPVTSERKQDDLTNNDVKTVMICDLLPKTIDPTDIVSNDTIPCEIKHVAPKINQATDYVQDKAQPSDLLLVHSGTNNISKESYATVNQRLERLETNIKHKKLRNVCLSSIVYRNNQFLDSKIRMVNNHIRSICARNKWSYIDNDNIDESCLSADSLHLNKNGLERMCVNFKLVVENFIKSGKMKNP